MKRVKDLSDRKSYQDIVAGIVFIMIIVVIILTIDRYTGHQNL